MTMSHTILIAAAVTLLPAGGALSADKMTNMPGMTMSTAPAPAAVTTHAAAGVV